MRNLVNKICVRKFDDFSKSKTVVHTLEILSDVLLHSVQLVEQIWLGRMRNQLRVLAVISTQKNPLLTFGGCRKCMDHLHQLFQFVNPVL